MVEAMKRTRVLIVDDDWQLGQTLQELVSSWEMDTECLQDALRAQDLIERRFWDLALLDLHMPRLTGLELMGRIRSQSPATRVILMTGQADKENAIAALRLGAFDFLEKPFTPDTLQSTLQRAEQSQRAKDERRNERLAALHRDLVDEVDRLKARNSRLREVNKSLLEAVGAAVRARRDFEQVIVPQLRSLASPRSDLENLRHRSVGLCQELLVLADTVEETAKRFFCDSEEPFHA